MQQILQLLQEKGILYFGQSTYLTAGDTKPRWQWDLFKIKKLQLSQNLADILGSKINQLPEETLKLLQVGSVIGNTFNESQVAQLSHLPESSVLGILTLALDQGLLLLTQYPENQEFANEFENSRTYQFSHDRIHHAVLSSISQQSRVLLDFKVAQNLQQHPKFGNTPALVFAATTHTNMATALVIESGQFSEAIGLNLKASHWAKEALAYKQAYKFIKAAIDFGNKGAWQGISISTKISVYLLASEIAFLTSLHDQVMPLSDVVLAESDNKIRKAKAYELRTLALIASNQAGAAISNALEGLHMLGINLPRKAEKGTIALDLLKSAVKLQGKKTEDLVSLPTMVDEKAMAAMRIMASMGSAVSRSAPTLFPLLVGQLIRLSIRYGNSVESIPAYSGYGILQSAAFTKPANAYRFGQVALELVERLQARQMIPKTYIVVYSFLDFLKNPIQNCYAPLMKAYQIGLEVGDHEFAATALMVRGIHGLLAGQALPELEEQYATYALRVANLNQTLLALQLSMFRQVVNNLRSESLEESLSFSGEFFNEQAVHKSFLDENRAAYFYINFCKLYQWVYQRNFSNAVSILPEMEAELEAVQGTLLYPNYLFYRSLVLLQHYHKISDTQKKAYNKKIKKGLNHLQKLARFAPSNFLNKYYLIKAEINRVKNQPETAFNAYNQAAAYAHQHNLLPEEALAYELAGRYYSSGHFNYPAPLFLQKAHDLYLQWGTTQLAHAISREYLYVYSKTPKQASSMVSTIPGSTSVLHNYSALELGSILKASTAIASEIQLEKFLNTLLPILIENAGAQKGCLLLQQQWPKWSIAAYSEAGQKATHESDSIKNIRREQTLQDIPTTIVHYVARTRQELIIKNAQHDARFKSDSSIQKLGIKSILCIPVISKGNPIAILYLENNLAGSAFTVNQLETLKILTGQIAISLENAMLYDQLELKVKERTQQLEENQRELERKNKALRDLNTEKDELVSIVAHDLRSPLNQIRGMANLIKLEEGTLSNDQKNYVDLISQSGERLGQMITNILSATSNADSKPKLQIEPININDLAQELVIHNIIGAKNKGIELIFDAKKEPLFVAIDRNYCFQALENLISNAIKFSPPNKQIIIRVSEVKAHQDNNMIRIEVQDEGPGITARDRKRLFSRFQTLSAKPTAGEASSGLGLSISKRFIAAMGGEIGVESEPGQGATFYVNLPKPSEAEA